MGWLSEQIIEWQGQHGRRELPWQGTRDPYRIWVSEIMLQQTQVSAVIPYYLNFLARFPDVHALAKASEEQVLAAWSGLGYYSRARNLHACAKRIVSEFGGAFPQKASQLALLPGIGRSTAAAIAAFSFGERAAILDGNVKRVFCRFFGVEGFPDSAQVLRSLWFRAEIELPDNGIEAYTQGLMDLGATLCSRSRPACERCPLAAGCVALADGRTAELPTPRPRRVLEQRATSMLIFLRGDEVLLERRPPTGIWGGLWSLPQLDENAIPEPGGFGVHEHSRLLLPEFEHAFTHFKLRIQPVLIEVASSALRSGVPHVDQTGAAPLNEGTQMQAEESAGKLWLSLHEIDAAALPKPVKSLLRELRELRGRRDSADLK